MPMWRSAGSPGGRVSREREKASRAKGIGARENYCA
jgi:hypothetical protein